MNRSGDLDVQVAEVAVLAAPLDHVEVPGEALAQGALDLLHQVEGLELRRDSRGHHQALRLAGRVAIARDQGSQRGRPLRHVRVPRGQDALREQEVRLQPQEAELVGRLGQPRAGREQGRAVALGVVEQEQALLGLEHDVQDPEAIGRGRRSLDQGLARAHHALVGTTLARLRRRLLSGAQHLLKGGELVFGDADDLGVRRLLRGGRTADQQQHPVQGCGRAQRFPSSLHSRFTSDRSGCTDGAWPG